MRLTVLDAGEAAVDAAVDGERVLVGPEDLERATGWTLKPEGLCRGPECVILREPVAGEDGRVDLAAVARNLGRALVIDEQGGVAALAGDVSSAPGAAPADDLELPDVHGRTIRMSDYAGRKRLLIAWASW